MKNNLTIRTLILFTFLLFVSFHIHAQESKKDVVYLKNGSIIKGTILEMVPNGILKIETSDGSIFIYKMEEVERTAKEEVIKKSNPTNNSEQEKAMYKEELKNSFSPAGYFVMARFGPNLHPISDALDVSVGLINGFQINEYLSLGLGVESTSFTYNDETSSVTIYPIFIDTRFYIPRKRVHPMFSIQYGFSVVGKEDKNEDYNSSNSYSDFVPSSGKGGMFMAFGAGVRIFITEKISMVGDGGFSFQRLEGHEASYNGYDVNYKTQTIASLRINAGIAISFGKKKISQ